MSCDRFEDSPPVVWADVAFKAQACETKEKHAYFSDFEKVSDTESGDPDVAALLGSLGLARFGPTLAMEEIDLYTLMQLDESHLEKLGFKMGPRFKILESANIARALKKEATHRWRNFIAFRPVQEIKHLWFSCHDQ